MPFVMTSEVHALPNRVLASSRPASFPSAEASAPGALARVVGLLRQGLTASWVPLCPDLANEIARGTGRQV